MTGPIDALFSAILDTVRRDDVVVYVSPGPGTADRVLAEMRLLKAAYDPGARQIMVVAPAAEHDPSVRAIAFRDVDVIHSPAAVVAHLARSGIDGGWIKDFDAGTATLRLVFGSAALTRVCGRAVADTGLFPPLTLDADDRARGERLMRDAGVHPSDPVVVLLPDHRIAAMAAWEPAIRFLLAEGYTVIRPGDPTDAPLPLAHPRLLDRPFAASAYAAAYAVATAAFLLRAPADDPDLAAAFATPALVVNAPPWLALPLPDDILLPRPVRWRAQDRLAPWREIVAAGLTTPADAADLVRRGIRLEDTPPDLIHNATIEMHRRRSGRFMPAPAAILRNETYRLVNRLLHEALKRRPAPDGEPDYFPPAVGGTLAEGFLAHHPEFLSGDIHAFALPERPVGGAADATLYDRLYAAAETAPPETGAGLCRRAVAWRPDAADAYVLLGDLLLPDDRARGYDAYRRARRLRPLSILPAVGGPPAFHALVLIAPGAGNTPFRYLIGGGYEARFLMLVPGAGPGAAPSAGDDRENERVATDADLVVNLIADADLSRDTLPLARALVERLGRPVVNHPARIADTDRASVAARLAGIPHCRVPRTARFTDTPPPGFVPPFLVRVAGRHGGEDFEPVADPGQLAAFTARHAGAEFYAIEPIDYRSPDGHYRKYRMILIGGAPLPYHLAIGDGWKVHHYSTAMADHLWMQEEEKTFLDHPETVTTPEQYAAFAAIGRALGLDYVGIDYGIDSAGNLVVFEANAAMLVHDDNDAYPYKAPAVARIKAAFAAMLAAKAANISPR